VPKPRTKPGPDSRDEELVQSFTPTPPRAEELAPDDLQFELPEGEGEELSTPLTDDIEPDITGEVENIDEELAKLSGTEHASRRPHRRFGIPRRRKTTTPDLPDPAKNVVEPTEETPTARPEATIPNGAVKTEDEVASKETKVSKGAINKPRFTLPWNWSPFRKKSSSEAKKPKSRRTRRVKEPVSTSTIRWIIRVLIFVVLPLAALRAMLMPNLIHQERTDRQGADKQIEAQLKELGTSSAFPLADAVAKARRLAYECFTVPNYGVKSDTDNLVTVQNNALKNAAIPAGAKLNCGWNGKGRGKVDDMQVVSDPYWVHTDRATIILQLKLYQRPGFFYYYVPFVNENGAANYAGMPAIFGTASGALDFVGSCNDQSGQPTEQMSHIAQLFLNALSGDESIDLGYLLYSDPSGDTSKNASFGGFGPSVSSPKVSQVLYCGAKGQEKLFEAMVSFKGPVEGSHYTLPYAFGVVSTKETNDRYQIKEFGPAPGYTGS
jgi:hypothetical protein